MSSATGDKHAARPGEVAIELPAGFDAGVYFIGRLRTPWKTRAECPKSGRYSRDVCTIEVDPRYAAGLLGIEKFPRIVVAYFMDQARRDLIVQAPRHLNDEARGTFALRSPVRPNPISLSIVKLVKAEGNKLTVIGLDCIDGTPLVDIKPHYPSPGDADFEPGIT